MKLFRLWPGMVFVLLGLNASVVALTLYLAHSDSSFAVEPDYYQRALAWDKSADERQASDKLGWSAALEVAPTDGGPPELIVRLVDALGVRIEDARVEVAAFASARASQRRVIALPQVEPGVYAAALTGAQPGQWEFRLTAIRNQDRFSFTAERAVPGAGESRP